jgi:hypothetical protein
MTKTKDPICRSFRQDFPQFVARAEALGVNISLGEGRRGYGRERVFWLDGYKQLTGYTTRSDGSPFTLDDAAREHRHGADSHRRMIATAVATLSVPQRFLRVITDMRKMTPQYRMIGEVHQPNGDGGFVFFMADLDGAVNLKDIGEVARAKAKWCANENSTAQHARFCDMLVADFAKRQQEDAA